MMQQSGRGGGENEVACANTNTNDTIMYVYTAYKTTHKAIHNQYEMTLEREER